MDQLTENDLAELDSICPGIVHRNVDLSAISQWHIGGVADIFLRPTTSEEVSTTIHWLYAKNMKYVVIGLTTNLLFSDEGLRVPCIQIAGNMNKIHINGEIVTAESGIWTTSFARKLQRAGLSGA